MEAPSFHFCPSCRHLQPWAGESPVRCARCAYLDDTPLASQFGCVEWDSSDDRGAMLTCYRALGKGVSRRKVRLLYCGIARTQFGSCRNRWFLEAVAAGEEWADSRIEPPQRDDLAGRLSANWRRDEEWRIVASMCVSRLSDRWFENLQPDREWAVAPMYREVLPNPFVPLEWNPDWFTSTVRDLAAHIHEKREFELMPILGDALMDAGCDHQLVLEHCRTANPHARGCWVIDAILGKS